MQVRGVGGSKTHLGKCFVPNIGGMEETGGKKHGFCKKMLTIDSEAGKLLFEFSLSPTPQCHNSCFKSQKHDQCNSGQLMQCRARPN